MVLQVMLFVFANGKTSHSRICQVAQEADAAKYQKRSGPPSFRRRTTNTRHVETVVACWFD